MSTLEMIVEELKTLPPPKLEEAAALIHGLRENTRTERWAALRRSASILSEADGADAPAHLLRGPYLVTGKRATDLQGRAGVEQYFYCLNSAAILSPP